MGAAALIATAVIASSALAPSLAGAGPAVPQAAGTSVRLSTTLVNFGPQRVGTFGRVKTVRITNTGTTVITLNSIRFRSGNATDFVAATGCFPSGHAPATLAPGASCGIGVRFAPRALNTRSVIVQIADSTSSSPHWVTIRGVGTEGYFLAGPTGGVAPFGDAHSHGQMLGHALSAPIVSMTTTPSGAGYWLLGGDGGIFSFGNARFFGSTGALRLTKPVVGMAQVRNRGYWLVAGDGGIFSFGSAKFFGSTGAMRLNQPVVGMAATPSGKGYWLVAADGGIFSFGNAKFFGSTGGLRLNQPIVGMAATPSGKGYWLVARDGGIFTFGDARFFGSTGGGSFGTMSGMAVTPDGGGYWLSNTAGQVFTFGNAPYYGDLYRLGAAGIVGVVATAPKLRPPGFAGTVLYLRTKAAIGTAPVPVPNAVPRTRRGLIRA